MAERIVKLVVSAYLDGDAYIVEIIEPATGRGQVIHDVQADSPRDAVDRVVAIIERRIERRAQQSFGDAAVVTPAQPLND